MAYESDVLILGGAGLVGSAFTRYCERTGRSYAIVEKENYAAMAGRECALLVNANGSSSKLLAARDPVADFDLNVRSVRATLADFRCEKYIHISTCDVYPDCSSAETTREEAPIDSTRQSLYGFHKYLAEQIVQQRAREWLIFRCGGFVGPGLRKNAIYDIVRGRPLFLDPESELQFLHTDRVAEIAMTLAESAVTREVLNLCGRGVVKLAEVAVLARKPVPVALGAPRVRYEVGIEKISRYVAVPETRAAVLEFARHELGLDAV